MTKSTFVENKNEPDKAEGAASLQTTAEEYANFIKGITSPENKIKDIFKPEVSMTTDDWALDREATPDQLKKLAWSAGGWALQVDENNKPTHAYHTGDGGKDGQHWRAMVAIDLDQNNPKAVVFFANSRNGFMLADHLITPIVNIDDGLQVFFTKFGFTRTPTPGWEEREKAAHAKNMAGLQAENKNSADTNDKGNTAAIVAKLGISVSDFKSAQTSERGDEKKNVVGEQNTPSPVLRSEVNQEQNTSMVTDSPRVRPK